MNMKAFGHHVVIHNDHTVEAGYWGYSRHAASANCRELTLWTNQEHEALKTFSLSHPVLPWLSHGETPRTKIVAVFASFFLFVLPDLPVLPKLQYIEKIISRVGGR